MSVKLITARDVLDVTEGLDEADTPAYHKARADTKRMEMDKAHKQSDVARLSIKIRDQRRKVAALHKQGSKGKRAR